MRQLTDQRGFTLPILLILIVIAAAAFVTFRYGWWWIGAPVALYFAIAAASILLRVKADSSSE